MNRSKIGSGGGASLKVGSNVFLKSRSRIQEIMYFDPTFFGLFLGYLISFGDLGGLGGHVSLNSRNCLGFFFTDFGLKIVVLVILPVLTVVCLKGAFPLGKTLRGTPKKTTGRAGREKSIWLNYQKKR